VLNDGRFDFNVLSLSAEVVVYVKRELQRYGFVSKDFATLPNDMSCGSRELLLALGWLMCKENVIDKFMRNRGLEIGEDTFVLHQVRKSSD
jgi:hypothetical protein